MFRRCPNCDRFFALEFRTIFLKGKTKWAIYVCKYCDHEEEFPRGGEWWRKGNGG